MKAVIVYSAYHYGNTKKLVGGIVKGHPTAEEITGAVWLFEEHV